MSNYNIKGSACEFKTTLLGNSLTLVCLKGWSINPVADTVETLGPGDGQWSIPDYDLFRYTILFNGLLRIADENGRVTGMDMFDAMRQMVEIPYTLAFLDGNSNLVVLSGQVISTNALIDRTVNNLVNTSFTLNGKGKLNKTTVGDTSTVVFKIGASNFGASNVLTEAVKTYPVNNYTVLLLTEETDNQQVSVTYKMPKLSGGSYSADYGLGIHTGISNVDIVSAVSSGSDWLVTVVFDFDPDTSGKTFLVIIN